MFNYIEFFYNRKPCHGNNHGVALLAHEQPHFEKLLAVREKGACETIVDWIKMCSLVQLMNLRKRPLMYKDFYK